MKYKTKKWVSTIIAAIIFMTMLPAGAYAADIGFTVVDGKITAYDGPGGDITIPNSVTVLERVVGLWRNAKTPVTGVTIPGTIETIGDSAFIYCDTLENVTIGYGVKTIGNQAFGSCTALKEVVIPDSVTKIEWYAFVACHSLTKVTIPPSVTEIGHYAFHYGAKDYDEETPIRGLTIYGVAGSYAEEYAATNNIPFVAIEGNLIDQGLPLTQDGAAPNISSADQWARDDINKAYGLGMVPSQLQSEYTKAATRAEFCALAVGLFETIMGKAITGRQSFTDTTDVNVEKMAALKVVNGVGNNKFDPSGTITREQAATMLSRLSEAIGYRLLNMTATFGDMKSVSDYAIVPVGQMQGANIMGGVGNNMFDPKGTYTREQSIVTMLRLYNFLALSDGFDTLGYNYNNDTGNNDSSVTEKPAELKMYAKQPGVPDFGALYGVDCYEEWTSKSTSSPEWQYHYIKSDADKAAQKMGISNIAKDYEKVLEDLGMNMWVTMGFDTVILYWGTPDYSVNIIHAPVGYYLHSGHSGVDEYVVSITKKT